MTTATLPESLSEPARDFASGPHNLLIGGERPEAADGATFETIDPSTGRPIGDVAQAGREDVDRAVRTAREAFEDGRWTALPAAQRSRLIMRLAELMEENDQALAELESLDNGKPVAMARMVDVRLAIEHFRYFAGWPTKISGETIPVSLPDTLCYSRKEPVGVAGQIIPWNFP